MWAKTPIAKWTGRKGSRATSVLDFIFSSSALPNRYCRRCTQCLLQSVPTHKSSLSPRFSTAKKRGPSLPSPFPRNRDGEHWVCPLHPTCVNALRAPPCGAGDACITGLTCRPSASRVFFLVSSFFFRLSCFFFLLSCVFFLLPSLVFFSLL